MIPIVIPVPTAVPAGGGWKSREPELTGAQRASMRDGDLYVKIWCDRSTRPGPLSLRWTVRVFRYPKTSWHLALESKFASTGWGARRVAKRLIRKWANNPEPAEVIKA